MCCNLQIVASISEANFNITFSSENSYELEGSDFDMKEKSI